MKKKLIVLLALIAALSGCSEQQPTESAEKEQVVIALLDTGVSTAAIEEGCLTAGHNYITGDDDTEDTSNHGTAVASVIVGCESAEVEGMAKDTLIVPLVVAGKEGSITPETLAQAIRDSVDIYNADIINISLGMKKDVPEMEEAVDYAESKGVLVISAAGNEGESDSRYYPAAYETVLAVGSHDEKMEVSNFSQRNGAADILAPGEDIWLASRNGKTYGARGTSYATGYVSAAAARLIEGNPSLTPSELREILCSSAKDMGAPGYDDDSGWGILDMEAALTELE